jgi:hypothetical protein
MRARRRLKASLTRLQETKQDKPEIIHGLLGIILNGTPTVLHPTRAGWNYVRVRGDTSEVVVAFNDQVQPVYNLPVLLQRDSINPSFYHVAGRDIGVYGSWGGGQTGGIARHHETHERNPAAPGSDIVDVYKQQFMPLALTPITPSGTMSVYVQSDFYLDDTIQRWWPGSGTVSFASLRPADHRKRFVSIWLDSQLGNLYYLTGTPFVSVPLITSYLPYIPLADMTRYIPIGAVLLLSGTVALGYSDFLDLRHIAGFTVRGTDYIARAMTWMGL